MRRTLAACFAKSSGITSSARATYDDGSRGDKARELALVKDFNQQVDSSTLDEFIVKVNGDTAVEGDERAVGFRR